MNSRETVIEALNFAIQETGNLTVLHTNAVASKVGLSATEFETLDIIRRHQPLTAGQLATYCGLTTGGITGIVDRLEVAGFVQRERDTFDRRRVFIQPVRNTKIEKKVRKLYRPMATMFHETIKQYDDEQLALLTNFFEAMNEKVKKVIEEVREK